MSYSSIIRNCLSKPIAFHRIFVDIAGGVAEGLFLSQLYYWMPRAKHDFIYKTFAEWQEEIGLTRREFESARKTLKQKGLLTEKQQGMDRKLWFKLDLDALDNLIVQISTNQSETVETTEKIQMPDCTNGNVRSGTSKCQIVHLQASDPPSDLYTENIYTEITPDIFESETQKPHISSSQVEVVECDRTDTPSPQKETNKSSLANKNTSEKTDFPSGNTEETILRDKLKSLYRKGYRQWSEDQVAFLRDQLSPFFEVWNTHKFPAFYPVTKPSARYLYFLLDFLIREGFEGCLELFEKAVKALSSDPFWTKQGKQRKAEDFPDIQFLIEDPRDYKGHIRKYSDRYRETPQGQQITPEDVEKAIEQKRVRDTAERLRRKFNYQEGIQPC